MGSGTLCITVGKHSSSANYCILVLFTFKASQVILNLCCKNKRSQGDKEERNFVTVTRWEFHFLKKMYVNAKIWNKLQSFAAKAEMWNALHLETEKSEGWNTLHTGINITNTYKKWR